MLKENEPGVDHCVATLEIQKGSLFASPTKSVLSCAECGFSKVSAIQSNLLCNPKNIAIQQAVSDLRAGLCKRWPTGVSKFQLPEKSPDFLPKSLRNT